MKYLTKTLSFLSKNGYTMVRDTDLGGTSHVFIVEKKKSKYALKVIRQEYLQTSSPVLEYNIMKYLSTNRMSYYLPAIEDWIEEINGFLMEYLEHPEVSNRSTMLYLLADALRTLHSVDIPELKGMKDHRSTTGNTLIDDLRETFNSIMSNDEEWRDLASTDHANLDAVRSKYEYYSRLLDIVEPLLSNTTYSLTHGDLAGDNIMVKKDGSLALIDWAEAAISTGLSDIAYLSTYSQWNKDAIEQFLTIYFSGDAGKARETLPIVDKLVKLYRYWSCIWSLRMVRDYKENGLDSIGRCFFETQLRKI